MGRVIAFSNQKGGVGKTTACINAAACFAKRGNRVLVIDTDPQGNATTGLGISKNSVKGGVYNAVVNGENPKEYIVNTCVENLFLLPSNINLYGAEVELAGRRNKEMCLKTAINGIKDCYEYICIDCPPSLGLLTVNALAAADGVIIPVLCEYYAAEGLGALINMIKLVNRNINPYIKTDGIFITSFDGRSLVARQIYQQINEHFGAEVFKTVIPKNVRIAESPSYGVPVVLHDPCSQGAAAYCSFIEEYIEKSAKSLVNRQ